MKLKHNGRNEEKTQKERKKERKNEGKKERKRQATKFKRMQQWHNGRKKISWAKTPIERKKERKKKERKKDRKKENKPGKFF